MTYIQLNKDVMVEGPEEEPYVDGRILWIKGHHAHRLTIKEYLKFKFGLVTAKELQQIHDPLK